MYIYYTRNLLQVDRILASIQRYNLLQKRSFQSWQNAEHGAVVASALLRLRNGRETSSLVAV